MGHFQRLPKDSDWRQKQNNGLKDIAAYIVAKYTTSLSYVKVLEIPYSLFFDSYSVDYRTAQKLI